MKTKTAKLIKQGDTEQFKQKTIIFHLEFTCVCNQKCSYCIEGNFSPDKPKEEPSRKEDLMGMLDKIFAAYDESVNLGFIIAGGEPTKQPYFIDVVNKIKSRKNAYMVLTTNFTESIDYYRELDIPLVTSLHLEWHEPKDWLEKTIALKDLIMETRIMAHPQMMDKVKEAYKLFMEASKEHLLNFAIDEILPFEININNNNPIKYTPNYNSEDLDWIRTHKPVTNKYPLSLVSKAGILRDLFYGAQWFYDNGEVKALELNKNSFKHWFCNRNIIVIKCNGDLLFGWGCHPPIKHNIFKEEKFPVKEVQSIVCRKDKCYLSFAASTPKYKFIKDAPFYENKFRLSFLKLQDKMMPKRVAKLLSLFIRKSADRKAFRQYWGE